MVKIKDIEELPLFKGLTGDELKAIAEIITSDVFPAGKPIFEEGEVTCPCIYIIQKGKVDVQKHNKDGDTLTLSVQREGSFFGELSFIDNKPHSRRSPRPPRNRWCSDRPERFRQARSAVPQCRLQGPHERRAGHLPACPPDEHTVCGHGRIRVRQDKEVNDGMSDQHEEAPFCRTAGEKIMFSDAIVQAIKKVQQRYPDQQGAVLPSLHIIQKEYGNLTYEAMRFVSQQLRVPESDVFGTATFYSLYRWKNPGRQPDPDLPQPVLLAPGRGNDDQASRKEARRR